MRKYPPMKKLPEKVTVPNEAYKEEHEATRQTDIRPTVYFASSVFPEVEAMDVDEEITIVAKIKMTNKRKEEYGYNKGNICGDFIFTALGPYYGETEEKDLNEEKNNIFNNLDPRRPIDDVGVKGIGIGRGIGGNGNDKISNY